MNLIILIITLLVVAFLLRIDFIYYIVYVCIGIYFISRWLVPYTMRHLQGSRKFNDHAFSGETVDITLLWQNTSRIPLPWLEVTESIPPELRRNESAAWAIGLGSRQKRRLEYQVRAGRRGYYQIGPARLTSGDLFGLVQPSSGQLGPDYLTVYPAIIPLVELGLPSRLPFGTIASQQRLFEDPARPAGVREYRSGDSQRQINWKASAHANHLLVRRYQPAISLETAILLDLNQASYEKKDWRYHTEWAIIVAASLAAHLANQRQPVGLISNGVDPMLAAEGLVFDQDSGRLLHDESEQSVISGMTATSLLPHSGRAHLMKLLETLARIESENTIGLDQWTATACAPLTWGVTIMAITAAGDEKTCQALHHLVRSGFNPILIAVEPDLHFGRTRERARQLGFRAYHVLRSANLELWRQPHGSLAQ
ncbi:MAG: DUF58 domain-containing protein [Candidatus Promineifilaceae bacterium]|jgi:uncharacterized protein (DUF58 family)